MAASSFREFRFRVHSLRVIDALRLEWTWAKDTALRDIDCKDTQQKAFAVLTT